jgi:DNA-binding GntR family transcriptional regulator
MAQKYWPFEDCRAMNIDQQLLDAAQSAPGPEADVAPIDRPNLHNVVVSRIRDMIIEGQLPCGVRIHEGQVGQLLGVSRTPLREALKVLAAEGLVDLVPNRGALVRKLTAKDVKDMLAVLASLEELAGKLACENGSDDDIKAIRALHNAMLKFYAKRDRLQYFKCNQQIHAALIALSGNEALMMLHGMLQARMKRIRFLGNRTEEQWAAAIADHEEMINALEARDGPRLVAAMLEHLTRTWERIQNAI